MDPGAYTFTLQHLRPWDGELDNELIYNFSVILASEWGEAPTPGEVDFYWTTGALTEEDYPGGVTGIDPTGPYIRVFIEPLDPAPAYYRVRIQREDGWTVNDAFRSPGSTRYMLAEPEWVEVWAVNYLNQEGPTVRLDEPASDESEATETGSRCSMVSGAPTSGVVLVMLFLFWGLNRRRMELSRG